MSEEFEKYQLIQDYLRGGLDEASIKKVEGLIESDQDFAQLYNEELQINMMLKSVSNADLKEEVAQTFAQEKVRKKYIILAIISGVVAAVVIVLGLLMGNDQEKQKAKPQSEKEVVTKLPQSTESSDVIIREEKKEGFEGAESPVVVDQKIDQTKKEPTASQNEPIGQEKKVAHNTETDQATTPEVKLGSETPEIKTPELTVSNETGEMPIDSDPCEGDKPQVDVERVQPCKFADNGELLITVYGGAEPIQYKLNGDLMESGNFTGLTHGTHSIEVKDALGCVLYNTPHLLARKRCQDVESAFDPSMTIWKYETMEQEVLLMIRNKIGVIVFQKEGVNPEWNGTDMSGRALPTDDYIFTIQKKGAIIDKGNVTIVRP